MRCTLLLLVLSLALFSSAEASRIRDGCKSSIKKYGKCLKKGFVSNLGCKYNSKKTLKGKKNKKCTKIETTAKDCGMSCAMAAIDGGWSDFGDWSDCDAVCGGGSQEKKRTCTNPAPENGGAECQGDDSERQDCNTQGCPIDGGWSDFGDWSECDAVCGGGSQEKKRTCTNPAPENGGAECQGDDSESQVCNTQGCPPAQLKFVSAVQDSTNHGGVADRAFDGNTAGAWPSNSCTHTAGNTYHYWDGTLAQKSAVNKVTIYNRLDCCQNRIDKAQVFVDNVYCDEVAYQLGKEMYEVDCGGKVGTTVRITVQRGALTLCEVEVTGTIV